MGKIKKRIGVMTSGGDAQGMNAAVRAVVRSGIARNVEVYAVLEGYQGLVDNRIQRMEWESVSGILQKGGTAIGTARCQEFRERSGRLKAAANLVKLGIDNLIVIGGDGSLTGANEFSVEWPDLLAELAGKGEISAEQLESHPKLRIVGMVGSIDNDMAETDMTIGADTALHRITEAIDALSSTAHSHQRIFVVEVMGRNCGYLALMGAVGTGAGAVFIPECPPPDDWKEKICKIMLAAKAAGRRDSILLVAEGATDRHGNPITCHDVKDALDKGMSMESRITILGHVQRGGAPSAFDRYMSTVSGVAAVRELLQEDAADESKLIVMRDNRIKSVPLMEAVNKTRAIAAEIRKLNCDKAAAMRGNSWNTMIEVFKTLCLAMPPRAEHPRENRRIGVMTCGWPAPGMNSAARTAVRLGMKRGDVMLGIHDGIVGLINDRVHEFNWMEVEQWNSEGGSKLGANREVPGRSDFYKIAQSIERHKFDGIVMIGGWPGYETVHSLWARRNEFSAFELPIVCVPASINNNLPGSELAIGADTALNTIVEAVDKIKQSADSSRRAFLVEVMGRYCGYLAMMSGLATGAEYTYIHETGITMEMLSEHVKCLINGFECCNRDTALLIRNEKANPTYSADFICSLFGEEGKNVFDVRKAVLGPMQQGGSPSPFDRLQGIRLAYEAMQTMQGKIDGGDNSYAFLGQSGGKNCVYDIDELKKMISETHQRPRKQWWENLLEIVTMLAINDQKPA